MSGLLFNLKEDLPIKLNTDLCILDAREGMALSSCHSRESLSSALRWLAESSELWIHRRKVMLSLMKGLWGEQTVPPAMCQGPQWRQRNSWLVSVGKSLFPLYAFLWRHMLLARCPNHFYRHRWNFNFNVSTVIFGGILCEEPECFSLEGKPYTALLLVFFPLRLCFKIWICNIIKPVICKHQVHSLFH